MTTNISQNFLEELGLSHLPEDKKASLLLDIGRILQQNIILMVLDELGEEDKNEFEQLLETKSGDQQAIFDFLKLKIPNMDAIIEQEIENFKKESRDILEGVK